eukprot:2137809-Amphidinium_carterae.1
MTQATLALFATLVFLQLDDFAQSISSVVGNDYGWNWTLLLMGLGVESLQIMPSKVSGCTRISYQGA